MKMYFDLLIIRNRNHISDGLYKISQKYSAKS